jgi:hypothetical protein
MMAVATSSLRIIGVSPDEGEGGPAYLTGTTVRVSADAEMAFPYQKMSVFYQKQHFFYHLPSR